MDQIVPGSKKVNVVYYTHPLCTVSWQMQDDWRAFVNAFGDAMSLKFCMPLQEPEAAAERSYTKAAQAVKAASLQSQWAADLYLEMLRKAALADNQDISQTQFLVDLARQISRNHRKMLDLQKFGDDFASPSTRRALQGDAAKIRINKIESCPTLTFTHEGRGIKASGPQTYSQLVQLMKKMKVVQPVSFLY